MKPFAHFLILAAILNVAGQFPLGPGPTLARALIEPGYYFIFSASTAAALNNRKAYVLLILALIVIIGYPNDLASFARLIIPEGLGLLVGELARKLILEERPTNEAHR